jgi:hypothetical protein
MIYRKTNRDKYNDDTNRLKVIIYLTLFLLSVILIISQYRQASHGSSFWSGGASRGYSKLVYPRTTLQEVNHA